MGTPKTKKKATAKKAAAKKKASKTGPSKKKAAAVKKAAVKQGAAKPAGKAGKAGKKKPAMRSKSVPDLEVDPEVLEFIAAIDRFKKEHARPFPTWSEILHVIRQMGYKR